MSNEICLACGIAELKDGTDFLTGRCKDCREKGIAANKNIIRNQEREIRRRERTNASYRGYGGWLAFFCVVQIFIAPVIALISLIAGFASVSQVANRYPSFMVIFLLQAAGDIAVVIFGVYAGVMLWGIRFDAVRVTKRYLWTGLVWAVFSLVLPSLGDFPANVRDALLAEDIKGLLRALVGFAIWYSYFNVSQRVQATYSQWEASTAVQGHITRNAQIIDADGGFYVGDRFFPTYARAKQYSDQLKIEENTRSQDATTSARPASTHHVPASTIHHSASQQDRLSSEQALIDSCTSILTKLGYKVTMSRDDKWDIIPPSGGTYFVYSLSQLQELTQEIVKRHEYKNDSATH